MNRQLNPKKVGILLIILVIFILAVLLIIRVFDRSEPNLNNIRDFNTEPLSYAPTPISYLTDTSDEFPISQPTQNSDTISQIAYTYDYSEGMDKFGRKIIFPIKNNQSYSTPADSCSKINQYEFIAPKTTSLRITKSELSSTKICKSEILGFQISVPKGWTCNEDIVSENSTDKSAERSVLTIASANVEISFSNLDYFTGKFTTCRADRVEEFFTNATTSSKSYYLGDGIGEIYGSAVDFQFSFFLNYADNMTLSLAEEEKEALLTILKSIKLK